MRFEVDGDRLIIQLAPDQSEWVKALELKIGELEGVVVSRGESNRQLNCELQRAVMNFRALQGATGYENLAGLSETFCLSSACMTGAPVPHVRTNCCPHD